MRNFGLVTLLVSLSLFIYCTSTSTNNDTNKSTPSLPYLNLHDTVKYVGMESCQSCHQDIYDTFIKTGMGQSFNHATPTKSAATFNEHAVVYDTINNFFYKPYWKSKDSLFVMEYRLEQNDTVYKKSQYVKYIVGSGQHTNSHIYEENGYLYQAPVTFYTQKGFWDLAPGFEEGFSSRFNRIIGVECMSCHNSLPNFVTGSENKYLDVPQGIGCERCHGPGEVHVKEKLAGVLVDTAKYVDYTIVNPKKLPTRDLQMNVCQRCHLQGVTVLKKGKDFRDFKPGMHLKEVMEVFLPEFDGNQTKFIMASQAHRLTKSACYQKSTMTCLNCHNPHVSVKVTPKQNFVAACQKCHQKQPSQQKTCSLPETERLSVNNNDCAACHMPVSGSIDIPHVTIHDHFIRKPIAEADKNKIERFIGLVNVANGNGDDLSLAKAYLQYYESYASDITLLDSVAFYLKKAKAKPLAAIAPQVHLAYLKNDFDGVLKAAKRVDISVLPDAWTAYRIGEAFLQKTDWVKAERYFKKALQMKALQPDFKSKLGITYLQQTKYNEAATAFEEVLKENPNHLAALTNLGFVYANLGQLNQADSLYLKALDLNPDYENALLNRAALLLLQRNKAGAQKILKKLLKLYPTNVKAKDIWEELKRR